MKKDEFINAASALVRQYLDNTALFDSDPQLCVNPATLALTLVNGSQMREAIEYSDEILEAAAASQGAADEDADDLQVRRNPDFYPLRSLIAPHPAPGFNPSIDPAPDAAAIEALAAVYASSFT